jgi:hypothetical protein
MKIEELKSEETNLLNLLKENRDKQREIYTTEYEESLSVGIGYKLEWMGGNTKRTGIVDRYEYAGVKPNYMICTLFNSDGKIGKRETRIWGSELKSIKVLDKPTA